MDISDTHSSTNSRITCFVSSRILVSICVLLMAIAVSLMCYN